MNWTPIAAGAVGPSHADLLAEPCICQPQNTDCKSFGSKTITNDTHTLNCLSDWNAEEVAEEVQQLLAEFASALATKAPAVSVQAHESKDMYSKLNDLLGPAFGESSELDTHISSMLQIHVVVTAALLACQIKALSKVWLLPSL